MLIRQIRHSLWLKIDMYRLSTILIVLALVLLVVSVVPWPFAVGEQGGGGPVEQERTEDGQSAAEATPTVDAAEYGRTLFMLKGCASCHTYVPITGDRLSIGPNLTNYVPKPEFLRIWLRDPAAVRPETRMPDLDLSEEEIDALVAFLSLSNDQ